MSFASLKIQTTHCKEHMREWKKIVVASDSFKGCLTSLEVASAVEIAILQKHPCCQVVKVGVADGGEGTVDAVTSSLNGESITVDVHDPLGRPIKAQYGIVEAKGVKTAVIEMAAASGLPLLAEGERNPLVTSTFGTGELILDAIHRGCRRIMVGIGGSATNDAGTGMLSALGFVFRDAEGHALEGCGASLERIVEIDDSGVMPEVRGAAFVVACDVDTPFCGPNGAACVFAPQKGASVEVVKRLDEGMYSFARVVKDKYNIDIIPTEGAGAAGGLGGTFCVFLGAHLTRGIDMVLDAIGFDELIKDSDLVVTGEGKIDYQTVKGKTAAGVLFRAQRKGIPVIAIGGRVEPCDELRSMGFAKICPINEPSTPLSLAMQNTYTHNRIHITIT